MEGEKGAGEGGKRETERRGRRRELTNFMTVEK
jgi:hypothetical protein